jgi:hypothetical protein
MFFRRGRFSSDRESLSGEDILFSYSEDDSMTNKPSEVSVGCAFKQEMNSAAIDASKQVPSEVSF